ncbi:MAG TPA: Piwi domain-containing protein [Mucilaginibacter sp.]|jgi:hypothetical protein
MTTNFFPIKFDFENYQINRIEASDGLLTELRAKHNITHSFFQHGGFVYISNKSGIELNLGITVTLSVKDDPEITGSLIKHVYFKTFLENYPGYKLSGFYPFVIQSTNTRNDLIRNYLPNSLKGRLSYVKELELQLRRCLVDGKESWGFLVNIDRRWKLDVNCSELHEKGFDLTGFEVISSVAIPGLESILLPDESLVGIVQHVVFDEATILTNDGEKTYRLGELYIRKTNKNIQAFLGFALKNADKAESIMTQLKLENAESINPKTIANDIEQSKQLLFYDKSKTPAIFQNKDGFCYGVILYPQISYKSFQMDSPLFVFDPSRVRVNTGSDYGLRSYGPYDSSQFSPKDPKVLLICHQDNRGRATQFVKELMDGIPNSKYFTKGFKAKYELHNISLDVQQILAFEILQIESVNAKLAYRPDIVIIEMPEAYKKVKLVSQSLYYLVKAYFLGLQIPIQVVTSETMRYYDEYKLNAIGLQMYAKLGGVPWTIQTKESVDREIIIGIGHSMFRNNVFAGSQQERIVGISTFFSGDGQYMMSGDIKDVAYENYFTELLASLKESIDTLSKEYAWRRNDTVRLIFHIFKPIKNIEFDVIKELIRNFDNYRVQFAFVTVTEFHPWLMFDPAQRGVTKGGAMIGEFVPSRTTNIVIDESSCLIQMIGPQEMKTVRHGASRPLLIRILKPTDENIEYEIRDLLFADLHYITQQIYKLTYLSWRGFQPGQKPATMLYSGLISNLLVKLRKMPGWRSEVINYNLKYKKWFL